MRFVSDRETIKSVAAFLRSEKTEIALAVAFWGGEALELLDVANWQTTNVRVICDALSGACNPKSLKELQQRFGDNLRTNGRLHAKVYLTPTKVMVTSANASASGLSLQDSEVEGNIEAGIESTSPELLEAAKKWFDSIFNSKETIKVDDDVIKQSEQMWKARRYGRRSLKQIDSITAALSDRALLEDCNICVAYYPYEPRDAEGERQHNILQSSWLMDKTPPVAIGGEIDFDCVDDYQDIPQRLKYYPWNSWIIDLCDSKLLFWYVPNRKRVIRNKGGSVTIPVYGARTVPIGRQLISLKRADFNELRKRWKRTIGKASADKLVRLQELAD